MVLRAEGIKIILSMGYQQLSNEYNLKIYKGSDKFHPRMDIISTINLKKVYTHKNYNIFEFPVNYGGYSHNCYTN